jgi:hypothetical protein
MPADLVVVGSRGHGAIQSRVFGSVSAEVVELAAARCSSPEAAGPSRSWLPG